MNDAKPVYQSLGASGLKVSKLWLGTMMFGDQTADTMTSRLFCTNVFLSTNTFLPKATDTTFEKLSLPLKSA